MKIQTAAIAFAKERLRSFDAGHDWSHTERVLNLARRIQSEESTGDTDVIELAAILHDIADTKFHEGSESDGGNIAYDFLTMNGFPGNKAGHVREIINNISFKKHAVKSEINSIEFMIVQDADRLDAMGAIGIARTFNYGGFRNRPLYDPDVPVKEYTDTQTYMNSASPTLNHFYEKLFLLRDLMNTKAGKKLAEERHIYMVDYVNRFLGEWEGRL
ncbi:MAG: HD domain-containing protein [Bacteroidales bacterium]|nr:HD domain-containing protein [Bacteroidales bacterium]